MHTLVLSLHSVVRWLVVILGLLAAGRSLAGWLGRGNWGPLEDRLGMWFTTVMDLQLLLGLLLYFFLSPITTTAFRNFGSALADPGRRFWVVEHLLTMVVAVILAHSGRALSRKSAVAATRYQRAAIFFSLAVLAILLAIPWPFTAAGAGRPWLRIG